MTNYRFTNEEKQQRINLLAADELAKGKRADKKSVKNLQRRSLL